LTGLARFVHETGRLAYPPRFRELLAALPWTTLGAAAQLGFGAEPVAARRERPEASVSPGVPGAPAIGARRAG
jgi:hypothetical protein